MKKLILCALIGLSASTVSAKNCDYSRDVEKEIDLNNAVDLTIEAGAGSLKIKGDSGRTSVMIKAQICASEEDALDKMDVTADVQGGQAHFKTIYPEKSLFGGDYKATINLELTVPATAKLDVADSSGAATVKQVAQLTMVDSSGELTIKSIAGDVTVTDSSGRLTLKKIDGNVEITDSSGGIEIEDVKQSVVILVDSSGGIEAQNIARDFIVEVDSSGAIEVENIGGDFIVKRDSSGGIRYDNVAGKVQLPDHSH